LHASNQTVEISGNDGFRFIKVQGEMAPLLLLSADDRLNGRVFKMFLLPGRGGMVNADATPRQQMHCNAFPFRAGIYDSTKGRQV
jgi:hypothetical protein